jgi:glycosyltransferase involved in cell wall biosynthesis
MKIALVANTAWYVANFRLNLMAALREAGHEVIAIAPPGEDVARIEAAGFAFCPWPLSGRGTHPLKELAAVHLLRRHLRLQRVEVVLSYTPKGNLYSALARTGLPRCRQLANVSGLGSAFLADNWLTRVVLTLYRLTFRRIDWVFFQNEDDRQLFLHRGLIEPQRCERIPGSGVDLRRFTPTPLPPDEPGRGRQVLMVARLLGDKGVREFVAAARLLRTRAAAQGLPLPRFTLLGDLAADNPTAISPDERAGWQAEGGVEVAGYQQDVRPALLRAHLVVLPSYREGVPRTLLEAGASGRPLVATDVPGCRDPVEHGVNGLLCAVRDPEALAAAIGRLLALPHAELSAMGRASAEKMRTEFAEERVIGRYLERLGSLSTPRS